MSESKLSPAEQARIRRERRQAKVSQAGTSRLNKITSTQGSGFRSEEPSTPTPTASTFQRSAVSLSPTSSDDPPDMDIVDHAPTFPTLSRGAISKEDELRQTMMMEQLFGRPPPGSDPGTPGGVPGTEDPFLQLFQQMSSMGGMPGIPGGAGLPPGMAGLAGMAGMAGMGGMSGIGQQQRQEAVPSASRSGLWWKILHGVVVMALALWAIGTGSSGFNGSELQRTESTNLARSEKPQLFWYFATLELLLQSMRYMIEKGRPPQGSILTTIGNFLPPPFSTYLTTLARYNVFFSTIMADIGVLIFVLGVASWWNS